jgi:DNA-binding MarR family transcriptional regulator
MNARLPATLDSAEPEAQGARPAPLSFGPLAGIAGFHLARATVTTQASFQRHIAAVFDINKIEFSLLMLVLSNPGIVPKRLARALAVTAPKLTLLLDGLQSRNLIQRQRNAADGRSQHLLLTERGRKLARNAAAAAEPMERELLGPLSRAEHAMLIELLAKVSGRA